MNMQTLVFLKELEARIENIERYIESMLQQNLRSGQRNPASGFVKKVQDIRNEYTSQTKPKGATK